MTGNVQDNKSPDRDDVSRAFAALDHWIDDNGWAGYDPYDVRGQDWYVRLFGAQNRVAAKLRSALALVEYSLPPLPLRRFLRIPREINPKGMGLLASAWLTRWHATGDDTFRQKAEHVLSWLEDNPCREYPGISWGYPFHWQSRIFLPRGTPSVVVTATVGDAWLQHHELTGSANSLRVASEIAEFFLLGLNRPIDEESRLCFSYTPLDDFRVHNASLFAAAFLARYGSIAGNDEHVELALRAVRYTLSEQNSDGSFYYWGSEPPNSIDHFHTGFVLRHLDTVRRHSGESFIEEPLRNGYRFFIEQLFTSDGQPKFSPDSQYPIDVHSCAEAILCVCQLAPDFGGAYRLEPTFRMCQDKMLRDDAWYIAEIRQRAGRESPVEIPYLRWGQAWMLLAFAHLLDTLDSGAPPRGELT